MDGPFYDNVSITILEARQAIKNTKFINTILYTNKNYFYREDCSEFEIMFKLPLNLNIIRNNAKIRSKTNFNDKIISICNYEIKKYYEKYGLGSVRLFYINDKQSIYREIIKVIIKELWCPTIFDKFKKYYKEWTYTPGNPGYNRIHNRFNCYTNIINLINNKSILKSKNSKSNNSKSNNSKLKHSKTYSVLQNKENNYFKTNNKKYKTDSDLDDTDLDDTDFDSDWSD